MSFGLLMKQEATRLLGWRPSSEAIATRLEAIATRVEAIAIRMEAIAIN